MLALHKELVVLQGQQRTSSRERDQLRSRLDSLKQQNADMEREVRRFEQRQELLKKAEVLAQKLVWAKYAVKEEQKKEAHLALKVRH
jgi:hypothetical protein